MGEVSLCIKITKETEQGVTITLSICGKGAQCYLRTKSALTFLGEADFIIHVGSDSLLLCS